MSTAGRPVNPSASHLEAARQLMADATARLDRLHVAIGPSVTAVADVASLRRRRMGEPLPGLEGGYLTLVQGADGLYDWQVDGGPAAAPRRRAVRRGLFDAQPIDQVAFKPVAGSEVAAFLQRLDGSFNERYGLFDLAGKRVDQVAASGRVLLVVHGTFSKCDAIVGQLRGIKGGAGARALAAATAHYQQVLLFEHPTLAVGPWLNALDLARAFADSNADIDVICHSRGGLVARWWLEVLSPRLLACARVVFVGSPLMGTGLASPYRLRTALKLLSNYALAAQAASGLAAVAVPMFAVVQGLMTLVASATSLLGRTAIPDAAVAMVPGLAAMSRYGPDGASFIQGNYEIEKLGYGWQAAPAGYFAVTSNFETDDPGWHFWRHFRKDRFADTATDMLFSGDNDLVVDTPSMRTIGLAPGPSATQPVDIPALPARRLDFGTNAEVHHLNYFSQAATVDFMRRVFGF